MTFAEMSFREELSAMLFQFNEHFQKLGWVPLAVTGDVIFIPFLEWIKEDEKRAADFLILNALDEESAAAAAKANVVNARELAKQYFNGLFRLYREYDKAVESAYRLACKKNGAPQEARSEEGPAKPAEPGPYNPGRTSPSRGQEKLPLRDAVA